VALPNCPDSGVFKTWLWYGQNNNFDHGRVPQQINVEWSFDPEGGFKYKLDEGDVRAFPGIEWTDWRDGGMKDNTEEDP
jgi:hypothetical protein